MLLQQYCHHVIVGWLLKILKHKRLTANWKKDDICRRIKCRYRFCVRSVCLVACISLHPGLCSAAYPCLVDCKGPYAGLHSIHNKPSAALASTTELVILANACALHKLMRSIKIDSHLPTYTRTLRWPHATQHDVTNRKQSYFMFASAEDNQTPTYIAYIYGGLGYAA